MGKEYTVHDVISAGCTLEPMVCLHCGSNEVTYNQFIRDAYCSDCGKWQLEEEILAKYRDFHSDIKKWVEEFEE